jgi:hypothetical protein
MVSVRREWPSDKGECASRLGCDTAAGVHFQVFGDWPASLQKSLENIALPGRHGAPSIHLLGQRILLEKFFFFLAVIGSLISSQPMRGDRASVFAPSQ